MIDRAADVVQVHVRGNRANGHAQEDDGQNEVQQLHGVLLESLLAEVTQLSILRAKSQVSDP